MTTVDPIRLVDLRETPLSVDEVRAAVADDAAGGTVLFVGSVRDHDGPAAAVTSLEYSAHPTAGAELRRVAADVVAAFPGCAVAATHRLGPLAVGDLAVVVAVSAAHRDAAFRASRLLIDELKSRVPIWKHQRFADGTEEWVGAGAGRPAGTTPVA
ncbi:molybdenum cofactor biosynthesis protein MoaE [Streptomyces sp. DSM 44915]|uniref:Molybdenum cofactor biosynthesis protein MoaE n=2 Tax=Streptomyces chisholmiae TaxID=3075540 RepID=A0ABU2JKK3_9ACTN|nr:molybdenum cofactor biosynthesis protein MoaE [Streptomyces sp. DSM 44915]MDT0265505.1 molybdenum cofactor biosynthesis protein MoaE [Streptomyces sp. DSM 44915]